MPSPCSAQDTGRCSCNIISPRLCENICVGVCVCASATGGMSMFMCMSSQSVHCVLCTVYLTLRMCERATCQCVCVCVCVLLIVQHMLFDCMWHKKKATNAAHMPCIACHSSSSCCYFCCCCFCCFCCHILLVFVNQDVSLCLSNY